MQITKEMLKSQLADAGLQHDDTVLIHSSMKRIGDAETYVLDAVKACDAVLKLLKNNPQFFMDSYQEK